jgi:hypothetical protein
VNSAAERGILKQGWHVCATTLVLECVALHADVRAFPSIIFDRSDVLVLLLQKPWNEPDGLSHDYALSKLAQVRFNLLLRPM